ncbi:EamA family transporter RarD [Phytohalomonas tamaricis]|uniref:EamA family transporter RarD n=1 Tax=Phytohalomonas tamaricis TaxID=2081032 RepID=UPI000D0B7E2F|nr:EamA family transporter RarD [Phytohalomonas tamaricis]
MPSSRLSSLPADREHTKGIGFGLLAYGMWGCFPLFFSLFDTTPAFEILTHRIIWSCIFLLLLVTAVRRWQPVIKALACPPQLARAAVCALLIAFNWWLYIWAVGHHEVLQASLGYFMTPLVNVALGMLVLKERMNRLQRVALLLAITGILIQLIRLGELPWISLALAGSFGCYGLFRKQIPLDSLTGLLVETLLLMPLALISFGWLFIQDSSHFGQQWPTSILLIASGILTALPLLAFAGATRRLTLMTVGFLMYLNPTLQLIFALVVFDEKLTPVELVTFCFIWASLILYSVASWQTVKDRTA